MRGLSVTTRMKKRASQIAFVSFVLLTSFYFWSAKTNPVVAGVTWGIPAKNEFIDGNGILKAKPGDVMAFRFYWYDPDVAQGRDKVKLHVCGPRIYLQETASGGACATKIVSSDWISELPDPTRPPFKSYTELPYIVTGNEAENCNIDDTGQCTLLFTFWVCDNGAGEPAKSECRNEKGDSKDSQNVAIGAGTLVLVGNNRPVADPQTVTVQEDTPRTILLSASDLDGDPLIFEATDPSHGALDRSATDTRSVIYKPDPNYFGPDSFTFTARDQKSTSVPATVTINVTPVNDAPRYTGTAINGVLNPTTPPRVTAAVPMSLEVYWIEIEDQPVKVHVCATNALVAGSEKSGGACVGTPLATTTNFGSSSPTTLSYTPPLADGGQDKTMFIFVCDNDATDGKCWPAQFNAVPYHVKTTYVLTTQIIGPANSGKVTSAPAGIDCGSGATDCSEPYEDQTSVTLTAAAAPGFVFTGWATTQGGGGCSGADVTCPLAMSSHKTLSATFAPTHNLTVSVTGSGSVTSAPGSIDCRTGNSGTCQGTFAEGTNVILTPVAAPDFTFTGWSSCTGTGTCSVSMNADRSETATFRPAVTLTVTKDATWQGVGSITGTVTSDPLGRTLPSFTCSFSTPCTQSFLQGTELRLTATPTAPSTFRNWSGSSCSGSGSCDITLNADSGVTVAFQANYPLTVNRVNGTVTRDSAGTACSPANADCALYAEKTVVKLTASANSGYIFTGWSGYNCPGTGECSVTMNQAHTVIANFATAITFTIRLLTGSSGSGTVMSTSITPPPGAPPATPINCSLSPTTTTCTGSYIQGTMLSLQQAPTGSPLSTFLGWTGAGCSGTGATCANITLSANTTLIMDYRATYTLTISKVGNGTVQTSAGTTPAINCGSTCSVPYGDGTSITLSALNSDSNYVFTGWSSAGLTCTGTGACGPFDMDQNRTVTATFMQPVVINSFTASSLNIAAGASTTLSWDVSHAAGTPPVSINNGIGTVSATGTRVVSPTATTTYILTANGVGGPLTRSVKITVNQRPIVSAGPAQSFPVGSPYTHTGATATDPDGDGMTYVWSWNGNCPTTCPPLSNAMGVVSGGVPGTPSFTPPAAGSYPLLLTVTDSGAPNAVVTATVTDITVTPPETRLTGCPQARDSSNTVATCASGGGAQFISRSQTPAFTFMATDPETPGGPFSYHCQLFRNGAPVSSTACNSGTISYTSTLITVNNTYRFEVVATDPPPSSVSDPTAATFTWTVEPNSPPTPTITKKFLGYDAFQGTNIATFSFSAIDSPPDEPISFRCEFDGVMIPSGSTSTCQSGLLSGQESPDWTRTGVSGGEHTLRVLAIDSLGAQAWSEPYTWFVPTVTITGGPNGQTIELSPQFTFDGDDGAGGGSLQYFCRIAPLQGSFSSCSSPYTPPTLQTNTTYTFEVYATSSSGAQSNLASQTFTIQSVAVNKPNFGSTITSWAGIALNQSNRAQVSFQGALYQCLDVSCSSWIDRGNAGSPPNIVKTRTGPEKIGMTYSSNRAVIYRQQNSDGSWGEAETVENRPSSEARFTSLVYHPDGRPMIFYDRQTFACSPDACYELRVAIRTASGTGGVGCNTTTAWNCVTLHQVVASSLALSGMAAQYDPADSAARVAYVWGNSLRFATCNNSDCTSATTAVVSGSNSSLLQSNVSYVRKSNTDHLLMNADGCSNGACNMSYATRTGAGAWQTTSIVSGFSTKVHGFAIDVNSDGMAEIVYGGTANGNSVSYIRCRNATCTDRSHRTLWTPSINTSAVPYIDMSLDTAGLLKAVYAVPNGSRGGYYLACAQQYCGAP